MGEKGSKRTTEATHAAAALAEVLSELGEVAEKGMFGGYGVFMDGLMFALVDSSGRQFFRVDDTTRPAYEAAGSDKHGRMPYMTIPEDVLADDGRLLEWGRSAHAVAVAARA